MLRRWLPKDRILRRALTGLLACVLLSLLAAGLGAWDAYQHGWSDEGRKALARTVWQYGPGSPEAAAMVKQIGETAYPKDVVALLDPATGKALAAWPADLTGKAPEEMAIAGGPRLPTLAMMQVRDHFTLPRPNAARPGALAPYQTDKISVRLTALYPWSSEDEGRRFVPAGGADGSATTGGTPGASGAGSSQPPRADQRDDSGHRDRASAVQPTAYLLVAAPPAGVTLPGVLASVAGVLGALGFVVYWLSLAWWVFADARRRGSEPFAWGSLALLTNLVGVAVYLVARQEWPDCPNCHAGVQKSFHHCPYCGHELKPVCAQCGRPLRKTWAYCADCGTPRVSPAAGSGE